MTLTHFIGRNMISICSCNAHTTRFFRIVTRAVIFIPIYVIQMIFQVYLKNHFPSTGYMFAFQWISILSILFAIPLCILIIIENYFDFISSALLLASGFALGNVLKSAFYLIFPRNIWETIPDRARTKDNYNANPNSSYDELSFSKGEILENANDNGKWWLLARNQNGETGFVQINYVSLYNSAHLFFYE
uniref:SH3 domain-containing protein n=1 Tax=Rhizophagus irregularis (strain DAOM 181602 / DAOM 197198 / MUCL 43194) TaxID=747089 RepID=U9TGB0_RHIID